MIRTQQRRRSTEINMVFDFLRKRSEEGVAQVQNIAEKALEGKLLEGIQDSVDYVKERQRIDAENLRRLTDGLSRTRDRLLGGISGVFVDEADTDIESRLSRLEDVLLQADIGASVTSTIISDLRSYARREGLQQEDIAPVLRARLVEALTPPEGNSGLNFTSVDSGLPTVIFVIGANGMGKTTTIGKYCPATRVSDQ
jgi:fused signal recognition particle receptor